jgi:hypothetical protein
MSRNHICVNTRGGIGARCDICFELMPQTPAQILRELADRLCKLANELDNPTE